MAYVTLEEGMSLAGRILPKDYYPEATDVFSSAADTIKAANSVMDASNINPENHRGTQLYTGEFGDVYDTPKVLSDEQVKTVLGVVVAMGNLDDAMKKLYDKASSDNGIPPTEKGETESSKSAYYDYDAMKYVHQNGQTFLGKWKWYEFQNSTPTNVFDAWEKSSREALGLPPPGKGHDLDDLISYLKWGALILGGLYVYNSLK